MSDRFMAYLKPFEEVDRLNVPASIDKEKKQFPLSKTARKPH